MGLATQPAGADDWLALTLYPGGSVYQSAHLEALVGASQNLWQLRDASGATPIKALDSLASTNAIAVQGDEVRFRRLIEMRELNPAGLKTLESLVEQHPLLGPRLVTPERQGTHFWFRLARPYSGAAQAELLAHYGDQLAGAFGPQCKVGPGERGALAGMTLTEWQLSTAQRPALLPTLKSLEQAGRQLRSTAQLSYSAADVLGYLKRVLDGQPGLPSSDAEVAQLYMIAESLRSRDLQDLARPDFQRLNLVALGDQGSPAAPQLDGYRTSIEARWSATPNSYLIVDCR